MSSDIDKHIEMDDLKTKFIDTGLLFGSVLGVAAFIPGALAIFEIGFDSSHYIDIIVLLLFFIIYIFRKRIEIGIKSICIITGLFLFAFSDLYFFGILSINKSLVIVAMFLFFLNFQLKKTIFIFAGFSIIFAIIAFLHLTSDIGYDIDHNKRAANVNIWIITYILITIISFSVILLLREYYKRFAKLVNTLETKNKHIQENESKYTEIYNAASDAIIIYDMPGNILEVNQAMREMFKCKGDEYIGRKPAEFSEGIPPYDEENSKKMIKKAILEGEHSFDWRSKDLEGNVFWTKVTLKKTILQGEDRVLAIIKDIDIEKCFALELEKHKNNLEEIVNERTEELQALNEELNESNERLSQMFDDLEYQKSLVDEKEKRLHTIIFNQGEGLTIVDLEENIKFANKVMHEIFDVDDGQLIGRNFKKFIAGDDWELVLSQTEKRKQKLRSTYEIKISSATGRSKYVILSAAPDYDENGKVIGAIANFRDITERIQEQQKLQELNEELTTSNEELNEAYRRLKKLNQDIAIQKAIIEKNEKRLHTVIHNQGEGLGITDLDENFVFASDAAHRILEVPEGLLVGKNLKEFFDDSEWEKLLKETQNRKKGKRTTYELTVSLLNGKKKHLIVTGSPDYNENGEIVGTIANFRDISERIQKEQRMLELNEELEVMNEELYEANNELSYQKNELQKTLDKLKETQQQLIQSEKMATLGILAAGVAHEINNPLNFIMGGVTALDHMLKDEELEMEEIEEIIQAVKEGVRRASVIVAGLGTFSRQTNTFDDNCDLHKIIDNSLMILHNKIKYKVELIKKYHSEDIIIKANEGKLHQIFLNILTNAVQAIEKKGVITITTELKKDHVHLSFKDTGKGIKEEYLNKITDPFFTTKEPGEGTGLGLSIVLQIIEEHNGYISFNSQEGKGTDVIIQLPLN
jgi:PAS domain S-box-containing protein